MIHSWKFSQTATVQAPDILKGKTPEQFLKDKYSGGLAFGLVNLQRSGIYREMGWAYDFRPFLRLFYVEQYGHIQREYAPNKTAVRRSNYGRITHIQELT